MHQALRQSTGREPEHRPGIKRQRRQRQSLFDLVVGLLTDAGQAMHVSDLVDVLQRDHGRMTDRDALASVLAKKARTRQRVQQTAPATFGLLPPGQERQS